MYRKMQPQILTKSQYMKGVQCDKALWFHVNRKDLQPAYESSPQVDAGIEVGDLARQLFPGGLLVSEQLEQPAIMTRKTQDAIAVGHTTLYEASALTEHGDFAKADILRKTADEWDLIEVKSSTSVKDYHIDDLAMQCHVFSESGYRITRCFLVLINSQYIRQGDIDIASLFKLVDVTEQIALKLDEVRKTILQLREVVSQKDEINTG